MIKGSRNIRLLYAHNFLNDFRLQQAFLVIYFAQIAGSYTMAMSILAVGTVTSALLDVATGIFSDRLGRKYIIVLGSLCCTLSVTCYAVAHGAVLLFVGSVFSGLSQALYSGNNNALLFESLREQGEESRFHHYQGRTSSMFQLALGLSALLSSLFTADGLRFIFVLGIIPQALAILVGFLFHEPKTTVAEQQSNWAHLKNALHSIRHNPRLMLLTVAQSISHGVGEAEFNFDNAFLALLCPLWAVPLYRSLNHGLGFVGYWFAGHAIDRFRNGAMLFVASAYGLISGGIATLLANSFSPALFASGSLFFGPYMVARDHLFQQEFTDEQRATMASIASFTGSLVFAMAALIIGQIADRFGVRSAVAFGILASATALPIYIRLFRKHLN